MSAIALSGRLVLVGAGKMGGAMLEGWLAAGVPGNRVVALDPAPPAEVADLIARHGVVRDADPAAIEDAEVVVIAVKPQVMDDVLGGVKGLARSRPLVVSVAAGKPIATFEAAFGPGTAVVRTIPNTPSAVGRGITAMACNAHVTPARKALAVALLESVGEVVEVTDEALIDTATAVSGSGPAYVFYLTECLAAAGEAEGLTRDVAVRLARATVAGAGELMRVSGLDAATLRQNVTSPNGTTFAALQVLMAADGLEPLMRKAVAAAHRRSRELAG